MELRPWMIVASLLVSLFCHRHGRIQTPVNLLKTFHLLAFMSCIFLSLAACVPCSVDGIRFSAEDDGCGFSGDGLGMGLPDMAVGDRLSSGTEQSPGSVCSNSNLFCFPSKVPGFSPKENKLGREEAFRVSRSQSDTPLAVGPTMASRWFSNETWASDSGMFEQFNGRTVSCSLDSKEITHESSFSETASGRTDSFSLCRGSLVNQKSIYVSQHRNSEISELSSFDTSSPNVKISPPVLDWGKKYLYFPSVAFLTVENSHNDTILHVYEPFSTNKQFYPCNFSEVLLGPGEVASICFVFLPKWLGLSSSHLILQTSSGGFLVSAKGFAIESPFKVQPLVDNNFPSNGRLRKNFSLFNPFDETLLVEEVTALISFSVGNATHQTEGICRVEDFSNIDDFSLLSVKDRLVVSSGVVGFPPVGMRPHRNWDISAQSSEDIIELEFSFGWEGKVFGAICMQLVRSSLNGSDTIVVPLEVDLGRKDIYNGLAYPVSVSLEPLMFDDSVGKVVVISLRNGASYMLNVVRITEVAETKLFQIKYLEGFLLYPGTVTQVGLVTCTQLSVDLYDSQPEETNIKENCNLLVLTNDSTNPQIEISCEDVLHACSRCHKDSYIGYEYEVENSESGNARTKLLVGGLQFSPQFKGLEIGEADESLLGNWKSQGMKSHTFVLEDDEILFPIVQVGAHGSRWIEVKNPSEESAVVQLILNGGELVDECRGTDDFLQLPSSGSLIHSKSNVPSRYGFSLAGDAVTEAYIHPYGRAFLGPVLFHPSNRCTWRSSVLIRNNLSGVEWLPLRGSGGSLSLILHEGSQLVKTLEFEVSNDTIPSEETTYACSHKLSKELYAKNTGDFPVEVRSIEVSGKVCALDGFTVHSCTGFSLEPGESKKILISYQSDFSAAIVCRDLELTLTTGILVIPMKANLPIVMLNLCKRSVFWTRLKRFLVIVVSISVSISFLFMMLFSLFALMMGSGPQHCSCKRDKSSLTSIRSTGKSSPSQRNHQNSKISLHGEVNRLLRSVTEDESFGQASVGKCSASQIGSPEEKTGHHAKPSSANHGHPISSSDTQKGKTVNLSESVVAENSETVEASQTENLTVRVGKEKGRRRRKRKGAGTGAAKTGLLEVSSSQSGNSTPSSPLSPVTFNESKYMVTHSADQHCVKGNQIPGYVSRPKQPQPQVPLGYYSSCYFSTPMQPSTQRIPTAVRPALLPSATFPSTRRTAPSISCDSSLLASTSTVAPHARAPGSNIYNQETTKIDEAGVRDDYTYDIWGDHFSKICLASISKDAAAMNPRAIENSSDSFFVKGPQTLVTNSPWKSVSSFKQEG